MDEIALEAQEKMNQVSQLNEQIKGETQQENVMAAQEEFMNSNAYDEIYEFYDNYIIAKRDDNLLILDQSDEVIKEIPLEGYRYDSYRSGYYKDAEKEGFHLFLDNNIDMY